MSAGPTVLVVDDDPDVTSWLVEALSSEERGFEARGETSALRAIEWIREHHVDIVISDVEMPELRGPDLLRLIHEVRPNQLVLLITAFGSIDLAVESGGNCALSRPGEVVEAHSVKIVGHLNVPSRLAVDASALYARNLVNFVTPLIDKGAKALKIDWSDELVKGTLVTKEGQVVHPMLTGAK